MAAVEPPESLGPGGRTLWAGMVKDREFTASELAQLEEACRAKDRLDKLDEVLRGEAETWMRLTHRLRTEDYELVIDDALTKANTTATSLRQLLASLTAKDAAPAAKPKGSPLDELANRRSARGAATPRAAGTRGSQQRRR